MKRRKPDPEDLLLTTLKTGASAEGTLHVADQTEDTEAFRTASVVAIGTGWRLDDTPAA